MMKKTLAAVVFLFATEQLLHADAVRPDGFTPLNIVSYSPGREDVAARDSVEYFQRTGNDIVLYSLTLHPQGKPAMETVDRAVASYRKFAALLKGTGVRPGILLQAILGHWARVDREVEPWQRAIKLNGEEKRFCPLDEGYRSYIRETAAKLAGCRPCLILTDDDVRAFSPDAECFCPLHTGEFNRRMGRNLTPETYRTLIANCDRTSPEHKAFTDLQRDTVLGVCKLIREGIDSADPMIPAGVCLAGWSWETLRTKDYAKALAAKGQRPFLRLPNGRYTERSPKWDLHDNVLFTQAYMNLLGDDLLLLDEADTWPHNLWAKSAVAVHAKLAASAFLGLNGAKLWLVNGHKGKHPVNRKYTDILAAHRGYYGAIAAAVEGAGTCGGVAIPCHGGYPFDHVKNLSRTMPYDANNWADRVFGVFGVPFHAAKCLDEGGIYALAGAKSVERFTDEELRQLLTRRVLIDGKATEALSKRGFAELTGVEVESEKPQFTAERDEDAGDDVTYPAGCAVGRFRPRSGAKTLTSFVWRPYAGADFDRVAPAATIFRNELGGTALCVAYHMDMGEPYSYSEARKEWLLRRLADLNGGTIPDGIVRDAQNALSVSRRAKDGAQLLYVANLNFDPTSSVSVSCARKPEDVRRLAANGDWLSAEWTWANGVLTIAGAMPCYEAAVIRINGVKDCFALAAGENVAQAELDDDDGLQAVCQRLVDEAVASGEQGGVQFCAYKDGKCIVDVWAGTLSTNAGAAKVDGRSLFPIFSTEKPLLATAVHRAVEKGLMDYDKPLCTWWPEFTGDGKERLTLGLTLGYRSGMPAKLDPAVFPTVEDQCDWSRICRWAAAVKPELEPGTKQRYMSLSYGWYLGHPLEVACGKPLKDCLDELVLEPAGVTDDFFFVTNEGCESRIATFYGGASVERMNDRRRWRFCLPSAYAVANARSVARFYNRLCGFDGKEPLIREETLDNALKPCRHPSDPLPDAETMKRDWFMIFGMGYGLWGEAERMDRVFGHGGAGGSEGLVDRDNRLVVAYTCNFDNYKGGLRQRLYDAVGMKWRYWKDKKADIQTLQMKTVKASRPRPNAAQLSRIRNGIERWGIVHWGLNTYTDREWGYGDEDPRLLDPDAFDADQIVSACKDGGLQGLVVVAKHHDGFCLWPTRTTEHNIGKSPFRGGRGDYVREMEQACRRAGLRFGVYCSPWDRNNADYATPKYVETYHAQIRELLDGRYGEIFEMWFDGANGGDGYYGGARERRKIPEGYYEFDKVFGFVRELQSNVCIFGMGGEYRWPGNEEGFLSDESRATMTSDKKRPDYARIKNTGLVDGDLFSICEADFPLRKGWFYHASESNTVRSGEFLMQRYLKTVGNGGAMNIGIAPNRHGRLDESDVRALKRFNEIRETFFGKEVGEGEAFNVVVLKEDVANGERVDGWELVNGGETIARGSAIGIKRIRTFDSPRVARQCHVRITAGDASPGSVEVRFYSVDADLLGLVMAATTGNGETDTAKWMMRGEEKQ